MLPCLTYNLIISPFHFAQAIRSIRHEPTKYVCNGSNCVLSFFVQPSGPRDTDEEGYDWEGVSDTFAQTSGTCEMTVSSVGGNDT